MQKLTQMLGVQILLLSHDFTEIKNPEYMEI